MEHEFWDKSWKSLDPERISSYSAGFDMSEDPIIAYLRKNKAKYVCDAGCGCGLYSLKLAKFGFDVSGFDIAESAVLLTEKLLLQAGYPAKIKRADVLSTGYPSGCFDAVISRDVLDHMPIEKGRKAVKELMRIVKPGGFLILTLDGTDGEYESEPHDINADGDYLFTAGKWQGMVFHPYSASEIDKLANGFKCDILASDGGFTVAVGAG